MTMTCWRRSSPCGAWLVRGPAALLWAADEVAHPTMARMAPVTIEAMRCMSEAPLERAFGAVMPPRGDRRPRDGCPFVTEAHLIVQPRGAAAPGTYAIAPAAAFSWSLAKR